MLKLDLLRGLKFISACIPVLCIISCVNDDYDFSKEIDLNANLFQNTSIPVGNIEKISVSDLLKNYSENESYLTYDSNGDLGIDFTGDQFFIEHQIVAPELPFLTTKASSDFDSQEPGVNDCVTFRLDQLPDFLRSDNVVLDIVDIRLDMLMTNSTPFGCSFSSTLTTDNLIVPIKDLHIEKGSPDSPFIKCFSFSEGNVEIPEGAESYKIEGLTSIIESMPDVITISDFKIVLDDFDYGTEGIIDIDYVPGATYVLRSDFSVYVPLAFGPEFKTSYSYTMDYDIHFGEFGIPSALLEFDVVNTLPLNVGLTVDFIDDKGQVLSGTSVSINENTFISAGTSENPAINSFSAAFESEDFPIKIGGFRFNIEASAAQGEEFRSTVNINDGFEIKNVRIVIPEGVNVDFGEII